MPGDRLAVQCSSLFVLFASCAASGQGPTTPAHRASVTIDAGKVDGTISPMLYGQFLEHMFQCIKFGLHAELIRDRGFEDEPNVLGLPRYWEPYPDGRNDVGMSFVSDQSVSYPGRPNPESGLREHSLRIDTHGGPRARQGLCQGGIPVRKDHEYDGYVWIKTSDYEGRVRVSLESEIEGTPPYAEASLGDIHGDWCSIAFACTPGMTIPWLGWWSSSRAGAGSGSTSCR